MPKKIEPSITETNINPIHYKDYIKKDEHTEALQWIETMSRIPRYSDPAVFIGAIELMIRKYLDRNFRKDNALQEYKKGLWYYKFLVAYLENDCKPIMVKDVEKILKKG